MKPTSAAVRLLHSARARPHPARRPRPPPRNRFVRFGYRRPPPWDPLESAEEHIPAPVPAEVSSWRELHNKLLTLAALPTPSPQPEVPTLAHGMHPVLRGDGVYPLEAPWTLARSSSHSSAPPRPFYNESLRRIVPPSQIDWQAIPGYIPAGSHSALHGFAVDTGANYCSSTSSISPALAALYHLLSNFRGTDLRGGLSSRLAELPADFAKMHRRPVAFTISKVGRGANGNVYSVNQHSGAASGPSILRDLGHSMERMLTTNPDEFAARYVKEKGLPSLQGPCGTDEQFYHYSRASKFVLRAQIDCRNPETGEVFDVKTRAVAPIRYDLDNYASFASHRLRFLRGKSDSYEREFYDMVRTVFLKYALQLRIGRMAGALVAYHNTSELLGLEYIPLKEIHSYVFGGDRWADIAFGTAVHLLEDVLQEVTSALCTDEPGESVKVVLCTEWSRLQMHVFAQRISASDADDFSPETFFSPSLNAAPASPKPLTAVKDIAADGQWHFDSFLHEHSRGISVIGADERIRALGGEQLGERPETVAAVPRRKPGSQAFNYTNFDCDGLTRERFRVWTLNVFPLLNEELAPRNTIQLGEDDSFRLKYELQEVEEVRKEHLAKFVNSLGRIYSR